MDAVRTLHTALTWPWLTSYRSRSTLYDADVVDKLLDSTMPKVAEWMATKTTANNCTLENAAVRREWSDLSIPEREDYIKAVQCLMNKPSKAPKDIAPGALSRFDDFVATHATQAMMLHDPVRCPIPRNPG